MVDAINKTEGDESYHDFADRPDDEWPSALLT
jgi:hypothetical protein